MKILIADDNEPLHNLLSIIIHSIGYETDSAYDGKEALEKVKANQYDILFIDYKMPEINGFDVARRLREHESINDIDSSYIVSISGLIDEFSEEYINLVSEYDEIIYCFINKPFNYQEIENAIHNMRHLYQ